MTDDRLLLLIDAYGAEPMAWPEDERDAAMAHLAANRAAFEPALAEARLLDHAFEASDVPDAPAGLAARILEAAPKASASPARRGFSIKSILMPNGARWPAGAALASLAMGLVGGYATAATSTPEYESPEQTVVYTALGYDGLSGFIDEMDG
ncbi:MAG: hypothetical protein RLN72_03545 [Henriciella sp.]